MNIYSEDGYEEGFYGSAFQDHSWTNKDGGLDEYFDGEVTVDDLISKIWVAKEIRLTKWKDYIH